MSSNYKIGKDVGRLQARVAALEKQLEDKCECKKGLLATEPGIRNTATTFTGNGINIWCGDDHAASVPPPFKMTASYTDNDYGTRCERCGSQSGGACPTDISGRSYFFPNNQMADYRFQISLVPGSINNYPNKKTLFSDVIGHPERQAFKWTPPLTNEGGGLFHNHVLNNFWNLEWLIALQLHHDNSSDGDLCYVLQVEQWGNRGRRWFHCGQDFSFWISH